MRRRLTKILAKNVDFHYLTDTIKGVERCAHNSVFECVARQSLLVKVVEMAEGKIKKLADKGFGFIDTGSNKDLFFHMSNLDGCRFEELQEGQTVEFTHGDGPKGPVAENVKII